MSKVINLKAIHNNDGHIEPIALVVSNVSKVINLKAIHNKNRDTEEKGCVVSNVSKVINLKAIHNAVDVGGGLITLFPMCQR